jgi:predicted metal-dependent peptidase
MNAAEKIMAARVQALSRWPYAASILFTFKLVEVNEGLDTMGVDSGLRLYYNPEFVAFMDVQELATVLLHEVLHVVHKHSLRFKLLKGSNPDAHIFNIAGDLGINHILKECGMKFPESTPPVTFDSFDPKMGLDPAKPTEDAYYKLLPKDEEAENPGSSVPDPDGKESEGEPALGDNEPEGKPDLEVEEPGNQTQPGEKAGEVGDAAAPEPGKMPGTQVGDCGSIAGGDPRPYELDSDDETSPAAGDEVVDVVMDDFATEALKHAKIHGDLPGGIARAVDDYLDPKIDWRRQLNALVRREVASISGRRDYSFRRPSRRQDALRGGRSEVILPSMRQQPPPDIAVVFDTSGSMQDSALRDAVAEIYGIAQGLSGKANLTAIPCDTEVTDFYKIRGLADVKKVQAIGGGGTDMRVGIAFAANLKPKPKVIVVITDGFTPWPQHKPKGITMVLALLTELSAQDQVPNWIEKLHLDS